MNNLLEALNQIFITNFHYIIFGIFTAAFLVELFFYFGFYLKISFYNTKPTVFHPKNPVSIIICARDEVDNLKKNLVRVLKQNDIQFEVFLTLDACVDNSIDYIKTFSETNPLLRYTVIPKDEKFTHGKKLALTVGIKGAKYEHLLMTDADCIPLSKVWAARMTAHFNDNISIVLGYGKYEPENSLLNKIIRYDTFFNAQQYLSMALRGIPYMGVGRNLAYTRSIYESQKGFSKHSHIESGDDDLFINAAANSKNCTVEISPESHTVSTAPNTFKRWFMQKCRHLKSSKEYKTKHKFLLTIEPISRYLVWFLPFALIIHQQLFFIALIMLVFRIILFMTVIKLNMNKLREKNFWLIAPIFDIILPVLIIVATIYNRIYKNKLKWK